MHTNSKEKMGSNHNIVQLSRIAGPTRGYAIPFIYASADEYDTDIEPYRTEACSYWRHKDQGQEGMPIFITHFRWIEGDQICEVSLF